MLQCSTRYTHTEEQRLCSWVSACNGSCCSTCNFRPCRNPQIRGSIRRHKTIDHYRHPTPTLGGTAWLSRYLGQEERDISTFSISGDCSQSPPVKLDVTLLREPSICHLFSFSPQSSPSSRLPISPSALGQTGRAGSLPVDAFKAERADRRISRIS